MTSEQKVMSVTTKLSFSKQTAATYVSVLKNSASDSESQENLISSTFNASLQEFHIFFNLDFLT